MGTVSVGATINPTIKALDKSNRERWDQFVLGCQQATFFHRAGWQQVIERSFGHNTHYLYAEIEGEIQGVLPLVHVKSRLFGNSLSSTPFCVCGGIVAITEPARMALESEACELAEKLGVDYLEMRNSEAVNTEWPTKDLYVSFRKTIDADPDVNLNNVPRKQRAMIRKGIKAGLKGEIDSDITRVYEAYSESVHNLGTPVFPKKYFETLKQVFADDCEPLVITDKNNRLIGGVLSFYFRNEVLPYYGGGTSEARAVKGNDFMYWELMKRACERGIQIFDYGRSKKGTGSYSFKKNWGFEPEPLCYEYFLVKADKVPDINPLNPKYRLFINMWKRLPLSVSKVLGPVIARNLG
ncbi:MAG: FemAB family PEP-CTERM system-associated protein [Gammaproteobacteria bacterium]|nr:FemAB family PEP-CTERM system-associated protein [Gammaproteobacteria bacterium]